MKPTIQEALEEAAGWADRDGVLSVADGGDCILVLVDEDRQGVAKGIPQTFLGYPVVVKFSDEITPQRHV